jgi:hypothetical protein
MGHSQLVVRTTGSNPVRSSRQHRRLRRRLLTCGSVLAFLALYAAIAYAPPVSQWGSTSEERRAAVAGDELVGDADVSWTRSITIDAPPEAVWPWLVQMGVDKGGFYTYDWAEQIAGLDPVHNTTRIHPEWQDLQVGDPVHPYPVGTPWIVMVLEPNRALVLGLEDRTWSLAYELRPRGATGTRLVTRFRNEKGSVFSYALDVPDLTIFPRLLTGVKQRAEGTLPGMPGTHTGHPFPLARLPVHLWATAAWVAGLAAAGALLGPRLGYGRWGRRRPHPGVTAAVAFVAGAGYMLSSDTPPVQFFTHSWAAGLGLAVATGLVLGRSLPPSVTSGDLQPRWLPRALAATAEAGMLIVLPATAVWQLATARGWTTSLLAHVWVGAVAVAVAVGTSLVAGRTTSNGDARRVAVTAAVLAAGFAATGSGTVPLLGAALIELRAHARRPVATGHDTARTFDPVLPSGDRRRVAA